MTSPTRALVIVLTLAVLVFVSACNVSAGATPTATPNLQATIDAATQATSAAGMAVQATVDSAVQATVQALPPTPTAGPEIDYVTLSEEELEELIDEAVTEAVEAT
jgi:hypothetical protein